MGKHRVTQRAGGQLVATGPMYNGEVNTVAAQTPMAEAEIAEVCGCGPSELRLLAAIMKSGNINQGYAQCYADQLALKIARGECSAERVQCRQPFQIAATGVAVGATVVHTITPVGLSFLRELILVRVTPAVAATFTIPTVVQMTSLGQFAVTGAMASNGAGQAANGFPLEAYGPNFQNYVVPTGVLFDSSNPLLISIRNDGAAGDYLAMGTYDQIRAG